MRDGDAYGFCCVCGTEFLVRAMRQVTPDPAPLFMCVRCFDIDNARHSQVTEGDDEWT